MLSTVLCQIVAYFLDIVQSLYLHFFCIHFCIQQKIKKILNAIALRAVDKLPSKKSVHCCSRFF